MSLLDEDIVNEKDRWIQAKTSGPIVPKGIRARRGDAVIFHVAQVNSAPLSFPFASPRHRLLLILPPFLSLDSLSFISNIPLHTIRYEPRIPAMWTISIAGSPAMSILCVAGSKFTLP
ncbi:hypothetical protein PAXRUDRAFT_17079 [Paxillus rubicundulus Ve08.2h10]|uniref:Uncharacterized protein n=1 Tax=Paxillus rubicundulus Ve08.2h10 TaxID=930991 RepID=A0A0D0CRS1_9AGAM|nr:hypothetical protein PAXRUDRAFT_17079 [Paxillus rubicundulus Ve08.2h10]